MHSAANWQDVYLGVSNLVCHTKILFNHICINSHMLCNCSVVGNKILPEYVVKTQGILRR